MTLAKISWKSLLACCLLAGCATGHEEGLSDLRSVKLSSGIELHYRDSGEGEPVIFIHGTLGNLTVWDSRAAKFAEAGYRTITYSRRYNHPNDNELRPNHSAAVEAEDLTDLIEALELPKVHLVGHSYGAYTALIVAIERPDLVQTITISEPPIISWLEDLPGEDAAQGREIYDKTFEHLVKPVRAAFENEGDEQAIRVFLNYVVPELEIDDKLMELVLPSASELRALNLWDGLYPRIDRDKVAKMTVPTLFMTGENSREDLKMVDRELDRLLPGAVRNRLIVSDATHAMWREKPDVCINAALEHIGKHPIKSD